MEKPELSPVEDQRGHGGPGNAGGGISGWGSTTRGKYHTRDTIPLTDYRADTLQKIHAHSSAETSGLGDSLQRIHTLSSTETSGYGDTVPSPTGVPSPEVYHRQRSYILAGNHGSGGHDTSPGRRFNPSPELTGIYGTGFGREGGVGAGRMCDGVAGLAAAQPAAVSAHGRCSAGPTQYGTGRDSAGVQPMNPAASFPPGTHRRGSYTPTDSPTFGRSRSNSTTAGKGTHFLGINTKSTWLKWSQERRNSFKHRLDVIELKQKDMEKHRVSTPVRKARKESVMFVSPKLESQHILKDELEEQQEKLHKQLNIQPKPKPKPPPKMKGKKNKNKMMVKEDEVKLSMNQWNALIAFWEHQLFVRCRYGGLSLSLLALILTIVAVLHQDWYRETEEYYGAIRASLWFECSSTLIGENCTIFYEIEGNGYNIGLWDKCYEIYSLDGTARKICMPKMPYWQNAVIGLLVFSVTFGFMATILSICGVCTTSLAKKIYYYHSAGEIYFICALSTTAALMVYPVALRLEQRLVAHTYGAGYGLGWGAAFFFFAAAMCMCLDDVVRTLAKGICGCCGNKDTPQGV